jgi:hypothetical protein
LAEFVIASIAGGVAKTGRSWNGTGAEQLASFLLGQNKSSFRACICAEVKHFHGVMPGYAPDDRLQGGPICLKVVRIASKSQLRDVLYYSVRSVLQ